MSKSRAPKRLRYFAVWFERPKGNQLFWGKHEEEYFTNKKELNSWLSKRPDSKWTDRWR